MSVYELPDDIDKEIYPLIEILNQTGYIRTISSCAGYTPLSDGTYKRHRLAEDVCPWLDFEPNNDALKCSQLLEYVSKRLANAYYWGLSPPVYACLPRPQRRQARRTGRSEPDPANLSPDARTSFEFYKRAGAEHLFWLDKPTFHINWRLDILPILKEGGIEALRRWSVEKPSGVVRTKEDIRKIYQLIEMAAREFEYGDAIEVPAFPTLEEQYESVREFLYSLPYLYLGPTDRRRRLAYRTRPICMDGQPCKHVDGAIYVVYPNVGGPIGYGDVRDFSAYTRVAELATHIAIRLHNNHAPQMSFCAGNILNLHEMPKASASHRFYEKADALSLFDSPLPLVVIYEAFEFLVGELDYEGRIPIRVLTGSDVLKIWKLFEMAARDFIKHDEPI